MIPTEDASKCLHRCYLYVCVVRVSVMHMEMYESPRMSNLKIDLKLPQVFATDRAFSVVIIIIIIIIITSSLKDDNIFSARTYLTYGPNKTWSNTYNI